MKFILLLFNIQSNTNLGQLTRTANAFGAEELCVIGRKKYSTYGNQKTSHKTKIRHFYKVKEALKYYQNLGFDIVGVEITKDAISINDKTFTNNTVFIMGNEGYGIQSNIISQCDYCVFIPQFGSGASLNVNTACGIVLNSFRKENSAHNEIQGCKFTPSTKINGR